MKGTRGTLSLVRWFLVAITAIFVATQVGLSVAGLARGDYGDAGMTVNWPEPVVRAVRAGYPADVAGVRAGDRMEIARMSLHDRMTVMGYRQALRSETVTAPIVRDGVERVYVLRYQQFAYPPRVLVRTILGLLTSILIAALTVFVLVQSPSVEAFGLWGFGVIWFQPYLGYLTPDWAVALGNGFIGDLIVATFCAGFIILPLRATGRWANRARYELAAVWFAVAAYLLNQYSDLLILAFGGTPPHWVTFLIVGNRFLLVVCAIIVAAIVVVALLRARGPARVRLRWIAIGFGCIVATALFVVGVQFFPALDFVVWPSFVQLLLSNAGFGTLAFAILRRDLFDVGFVFNRAAIYTALTAVLVAAFAGLNWSIGVLLKQTGLALPIDVILAAAVGLSLNTIQRRVDRIIDQVFFRHRYEAELRLRRVARALGQITDERAIAHALVLEPVETLSLHAAALYTLTDDGNYELASARGWPEGSPTCVDGGDPMLVHLAGVRDGLSLDSVPHDAAFPHGAPRPRIAFPLWGRQELAGFVLYSSHRSGATLDPDEMESIERIATAASLALERVATITLQKALAGVHDQFTALKADFDAVRSRQDELLAMLMGTPIGPARAIGSESSG
jgi:hypothetical protein